MACYRLALGQKSSASKNRSHSSQARRFFNMLNCRDVCMFEKKSLGFELVTELDDRLVRQTLDCLNTHGERQLSFNRLSKAASHF